MEHFFTFRLCKLPPEMWAVSRNIRNFLRARFFFSSSESQFLKHKEFCWGFRFLKYRNSFPLRDFKGFLGGFCFLILEDKKLSFPASFTPGNIRKYKKFFNIRAKKVPFPEIQGISCQVDFFSFFELGSKSAPGSCKLYFLWDKCDLVKG